MKHKLLLFVLLTASLPIFATGSIKERLSPNETLWFTYPARNWSEQALHIGNGYMGASFYGDVEKERFDIAEKTFWTGGPHSVPDFNYGVVKGGKDKIAAIRRSITDRRFAEADSLSRLYMVGDYTNYGYFQWSVTCLWTLERKTSRYRIICVVLICLLPEGSSNIPKEMSGSTANTFAVIPTN